MRIQVGLVKRAAARLTGAMQGVRFERVRVRGRAVAGRLGRAVARGRLGRTLARIWAPVARRAASVVASSRLARVARERLERPHVIGMLAGAGTALVLFALTPLLGSADESRAADARPLRVAQASAVASPTRFELAADAAQQRRPSRGGRDYYRRTTSRHVPQSAEPAFMPLYREAARTFGVAWQLIASIHRQETAFSTVPGIYHGLNAFGCCAGPMQFNLTNGPPTTWQLYRASFRRGKRPHDYPHRTRRHPSVYDDFDAIMAAGALLRDSGAAGALDGGAWSAAYAYYGHDDFGVEYANQVVARAQGWQLYGFCLNCPPDAALMAVLDDLYGVDARRRLRAEERRHGHKKHERDGKHDDDDASGRSRVQADVPREQPYVPGSSREHVATPQAPAPSATSTTPATTSTAPAATPATPAPPAKKPCTPVTRLLGCRP